MKFKGLNLTNAAEGYVQTSIWTETLFNVNPVELVTGVVGGKYNPGADGGSVITVPELLGAGKGGVGGNFGSYAADLPQAIGRNIAGGWGHKTSVGVMDVAGGLVMPAIKTAAVGAGFKWGKKLTSRPRAKVNKYLRDFGLGDLIRV
jgi:hypothetical protein